MGNNGWEIQPAGWILFFILLALLAYYIIKRLHRPSDENQ